MVAAGIRHHRLLSDRRRSVMLYDYVLVNREVESSVDTLVSIVKVTRSQRERIEEQIGLILEGIDVGDV